MTTIAKWPGVEEAIDQIRDALGQAHEIGCLAHKDADADSLGSALAFTLALRAAGKKVHLLVPSPMPRMLQYLPGYDTIAVDTPENLDLLFTFDCATLDRFGDKRELVEKTATVVNVDHHVSSEGFGTINVIEVSASATGQVVRKLLAALGLPLTPEIATNLYAALFTDTGGFRHENTTEAALRLGADLVAAGANAGWVALKSYKSRAVPQVKLEGLAIAQMQSDLEGRLIWSMVNTDMLRQAGADMMQSEGIIDALQSIDSMCIAVLFKEFGRRTKISVRTRDPYDATALCMPFGGGGHHRAAGADLDKPLATAQELVLAEARRLLLRP